ncbi:type IV toxin-antitoxin system AbiEi family antitoxin [Luteitalea sp.]|uniref:type IV toxin-antitoxin system AbiEi family antitoxin n=1 Tax=Luteitalea sp. TaxID=2004800 RepID=UPI0025B8477E|nr:type IV toxin-antitoxin system AbiEi family antitoxin [Luteitalea sp.]
MADVIAAVRGRLPANWAGTILRPSKTADGETVEAVLRVQRKGAAAGTIRVNAKSRVEPKDVDYLAASLQPTADEPVLIAAPHLSPRTQERLRSRGFAYADLTGNVRLEMTQPGLFIETTGARENPEPSPRERKSLKGAKAGRLVRALCDYRAPVGLRELAKRAGVDPGYASRVVELLDREALVTRTPRGPITAVDWRGLLTRWAQEYSPFRRQGATMYLAARGIPAVTERLKQLKVRYAVTGSWAAAEVAPVAPPRLLTVYVDRPRDVEQALDLRPAEAGANVALFTPFDDIVFERTSVKKGVTVAAMSQIAADLLTSPGRGPNEAEALMQWMQENEDAWRTGETRDLRTAVS